MPNTESREPNAGFLTPHPKIRRQKTDVRRQILQPQIARLYALGSPPPVISRTPPFTPCPLRSALCHIPQPRTQHPIPNPQYPIPDTQSPIPNTQYPIPNTQYPIPNTQYPVPSTQYPKTTPWSTAAKAPVGGIQQSAQLKPGI